MLLKKFSIIMPSYLGWYKSAAKNREHKIVRAINSVLDQSFQDFELIVISDGCTRTIEIVKEIKSDKIRLLKIAKQRMWSGLVRNAGIVKAEGEWICYLDIDDMFGIDHLKIINRQLTKDVDWVWFNDRSYDKGANTFNEHFCELKRAKCGTSNLCHKNIVGWTKDNNYLQDWNFVLNLMQASDNYKKIETPQYLVCHVPGLLDYDGGRC